MKFLKAKCLTVVLFTLFAFSIVQTQNITNTDIDPSNIRNDTNMDLNTNPPSMYNYCSGLGICNLIYYKLGLCISYPDNGICHVSVTM